MTLEFKGNIMIVVQEPKVNNSDDESNESNERGNRNKAILPATTVPVSLSGSFLLDSRVFRFKAQSLTDPSTTARVETTIPSSTSAAESVESFRLPSFTDKELANYLRDGVGSLEDQILTQILDNSSAVRTYFLLQQQQQQGQQGQQGAAHPLPQFLSTPKTIVLEYLDDEDDWISLTSPHRQAGCCATTTEEENEIPSLDHGSDAFVTLADLLEEGRLTQLCLRVVAQVDWLADTHNHPQDTAGADISPLVLSHPSSSAVVGTVVPPPSQNTFFGGEKSDEHGEGDSKVLDDDESFDDEADDESYGKTYQEPCDWKEKASSNVDSQHVSSKLTHHHVNTLLDDVESVIEDSSTEAEDGDTLRDRAAHAHLISRDVGPFVQHETVSTASTHSPRNEGHASAVLRAAPHAPVPPLMSLPMANGATPRLIHRRPPMQRLTPLRETTVGIAPLPSPPGNRFNGAPPSASSSNSLYCPLEPATPRVTHCPSLKTPLQNFAGWFGF